MNDIAGMRFGRLVAVEPAREKSGYWVCSCDCGNTTIVRHDHLETGKTLSCGCYAREIASANGRQLLTKHGWYGTSLYKRWIGMRYRCNNPNSSMWHLYGGRGIRVCDEWNNSFMAFKDWALANGYEETAPTGELTLDRIDTNGNYEPSNCRWISIFDQQSNRRNNRHVEYRGKQYTIAQLARKFNMYEQTLVKRLERGMTPEEAVSAKCKRTQRKKRSRKQKVNS